MTEDYFWGMNLDKNKSSDIWDPDFKGGVNEDNPYRGEHTLLVKQAILGVDAKDEFTVIEVETTGYKKDVKIPIAVLKPGSCGQVPLDLMFPDPPVMFRITKGSGPVTLLGNHSIGSGDPTADEDDELDEEFDEDDEIDVSPEKNNSDKKRKAGLNSHGKKIDPGKRPKPEDD